MRGFLSPEELLNALQPPPRAGRSSTFLVGVDGCGGSGKSAVADWIARAIPGASIVHVDDFYRPSDERKLPDGAQRPIGWDFDYLRLEREVLARLAAGCTARYRVYDWAHDELGESRDVPPGYVVIVEGVTAIRRELSEYYDLTIWVECPRELRLARGLERDGEEARAVWEEEWMPAEDRYVAEHRPGERADIVIDGTTFLRNAS